MSDDSQEMISWMLPIPKLEPLILGKNPVTLTYTIVNNSSDWVEIKKVGLDGSDDPRILMVGGTCKKGLHLEPQKLCTIDVQISPLALGALQQILYVQHSGKHSPLWLEISSVVMMTPLTTDSNNSFLIQDTPDMENARRVQEQKGHKKFGKVHASDRNLAYTSPEHGMENANQAQVKQHPYFAQNQRYDGVENKITPDPTNNPDAQKKYQEKQEEQELAKQLRLGNTTKFTTTPTPKPY